ncbi:hypothetical protein L6164_001241 [Bauhinia variegata]|uniref:Uncharacterized protein n=1 Tax=Bauhinia variegata TaxID=167791 RepID=A0ACB9Q8U5_BAUVA|nr:hypothetical protein L6164_001241 [Bauhinia variegata]
MLKYVFGQYHHEHNSIHLNNNQEIQIDLPALESLCLQGLPKIISICQNNFHATWPPLKSLLLKDCPSLSMTSLSDLMAHYDTRQLGNKTGKDLAKKVSTNKMIDKDYQEFGEIRFQVHAEVELVEQQSRSVSFSTNQHEPLEVPQTDNTASNEVIEATIVTSSIYSEARKPSAESLVLPQVLASETTALIERKPNFTDADAIVKSKHTQAEKTVTQENMEAFYASIDADSSALPLAENTSTNIGSVIIPPCEETQKALQILQDLVTKKFSLLLHPGRTGIVKNVLDHLLSLSPDDGISLRMKFVIMQLSRSFRQWSLDYNDASLKLESATANQSSIVKLEERLAANVKEFREAAMLESEAISKLANLEAKKRELEDQINSIK